MNSEDLVKKHLNVTNPTLVKTGVGGFLVNLLENIQQDNKFYNKSLSEEISPVTAKKTNNLLYHSDLKGVEVSYSRPSDVQISFIIPDIAVREGEIFTYTIYPTNILEDEKGLRYQLEETVKIYFSKDITAKSFSGDNIEDLEIYQTVVNNEKIYLVNKMVKQYKRIFKEVQVPYGNYEIKMDIPLEKIHEVHCWELKDNEKFNTNDLLKTPSYKIIDVLNCENLQVKYNKILSNHTDNHIFLSGDTTSITFETGDGIQGKEIKRLLIEVKETEGFSGNITSANIIVDNVNLVKTTINGGSESDVTSLKVVAIDGGQNGSTLNVEELRRKILQTRYSSLTTIASLREAFHDTEKPFITKKYFNSNHNLFIYNVLKDPISSEIIRSTTLNLPEDDLLDNAFMPETVIGGVEVISPFYYKKKKDQYYSYLVLPEIKLDINPELTTPDEIVIQNQIGLYLTYNWFERKAYLQLKNFNAEQKYYVNTNITQFVFDATNNFKLELNKTYLNKYCFLDGENREIFDPDGSITIDGFIKINSINVYKNEIKIMNFVGNNKTYTQIKRKQTHPYWVDVDLFDTRLTEKTVLNIPYIDKSYIHNADLIKFNQLLDRFFKIEELERLDLLNPNIVHTQALYNTINVEDKYRNYIFETYSLVNTKINLNIDVFINQLELNNTEKDVKQLTTEIEWIIRPLLNKISGNNLEFYESKLEFAILEKINETFNVIENVKIWPNGPIITRPDKEIQYLFEEHFTIDNNLYTEENIKTINENGGFPKLTQKEQVDFVPNYFYFGDINLNISFK